VEALGVLKARLLETVVLIGVIAQLPAALCHPQPGWRLHVQTAAAAAACTAAWEVHQQAQGDASVLLAASLAFALACLGSARSAAPVMMVALAAGVGAVAGRACASAGATLMRSYQLASRSVNAGKKQLKDD